MLFSRIALAALLQYPFSSYRASIQEHDDPTVQLGPATVVGTRNGSIDSFLGVPFAQPPIGDLRLRQPQLLTSAPNIPLELLLDVAPLLTLFSENPDVPQSEDCLYLNIIRPSDISADANLPVLLWIYGGGFALGSNSMGFYNGSAVVQKSMDIGQPIIFVAVNYRLNVFGFLGGQEVKDAGLGNLGLQDQRAALRWVNRFISAFGGDPNKLGESAGAISVALHMLTNDGDTEGLFRAGIMSSGSLVPTGDITDLQSTYDFVVDEVGCADESDTLACLRTVSSDSLLTAANNTPGLTSLGGLATPYMPHADGVFIKEPIQELALKGKLARIPFIIGDVKDEGTLFSLGNLNITTDDEFANFIAQFWFLGASIADIQPILQAYPSDPSAGSPFDTGSANAFTPQYKRIAALQGDWFFQAQRRALLAEYASTHQAYNFLSARGNFPGIGDVHGSDLLTAFGPGDMTDYFVRFVNNLNPNGADAIQWPLFNTSARATLQFNDGDTPLEITADIERVNATDTVFQLSRRFVF
ncbi:carotenoid ester lipase precursor [Fomes fomentarius]|nr:carotenoid ester lipase precursor [Fomes fomentarius]